MGPGPMERSIFDILENQEDPDEIMRQMEAEVEEIPKETYPRPRRVTAHYNYIPRAPRNLPYMRRAY